MKKFRRKRYTVQAKRRNTDEPWSDWTDTNNYRQAVNHACHVEEVGYLATIVVREKQVEELWDILGKNEHEKVDAILDAGFRKQNEVAKDILGIMEQMISCYINGDIDDETFNSLFNKLKKKYCDCRDCKYFVGCECFSGNTCKEFELAGG